MKVGDRVRWREQDTPPPVQVGDRVRGPADGRWYTVTDDGTEWAYGWARYVFQDGTARIIADSGLIVYRCLKYRYTEVVSAVDALAALAAEDKTDGR